MKPIRPSEYSNKNSVSSDNNSLDYLSSDYSLSESEIFEEMFNESGLTKEEILILISNLTKLSGNIVSPGFYPISGTLELTSFIKTLGGFTPDADIENIELKDTQKQITKKNIFYPGVSVFVPSKKHTQKKISYF